MSYPSDAAAAAYDAAMAEAVALLDAEANGAPTPIFIRREVAGAIADIYSDAWSQYGEILAEAGASAFAIYGNSADAMSVARQEVSEPQSTPLIREAEAVVCLFRDLEVYLPDDAIHVTPYRHNAPIDPTDLPF